MRRVIGPVPGGVQSRGAAALSSLPAIRKTHPAPASSCQKYSNSHPRLMRHAQDRHHPRHAPRFPRGKRAGKCTFSSPGICANSGPPLSARDGKFEFSDPEFSKIPHRPRCARHNISPVAHRPPHQPRPPQTPTPTRYRQNTDVIPTSRSFQTKAINLRIAPGPCNSPVPRSNLLP